MEDQVQDAVEAVAVEEQAPKPRKRAKVACRVLRDYWTDAEPPHNRIRKGTIVDVTSEEAMDGMEAGTLERVKA